ncbi:hypothetical protein MUB23_01745 [Cuneatibacter sp. NSJ-177]|uniref:hypothetical protein n=1 Tax=Cuneatibacter sp. NSJ-177 TaxID=2931401 RepID=UPI001FCFFE40|nr:hypothetical protein [Cuneatibacter sp. NSJ-177]MCJ7834119.1 hypothetical protein [Cuneatibacter sp. NSJ-177]
MERFVVVGQGSDYGAVRWNDLKKMENAVYLEAPFVSNNAVSDTLCHAHASFTVNNCIPLPCKRIWKKKYSLNKVAIHPGDHYFIIFTDIALARYDVKYVAEYKKRHSNVTLVLMINNAMYLREKLLKNHLQHMDLIYSFSEKDAGDYKFLFQPDIYSEINPEDAPEIQSDLFFAGNANDRVDLLNDLGRYMLDHSVNAHIYVQNTKDKDKKVPEGIHYNEWLSYATIMDENLHTNCILEVVGDRYTGMTLRTVEALCFKKKLLTNNYTIEHMPFYDPRFIHIFKKENLESIDLEFIKKRETVTYNYDNEYSPIVFCKRVQMDFEEGKRYVLG